MTNDTIYHFKQVLLEELRGLEERRRNGTLGPSREEVIESIEGRLGEVGLVPWQLYLNILADTGATPRYRSTAANLLHNPNRVPEHTAATQEIADAVVKVIQEENLDPNPGMQTFMAAGILRTYVPATQMLPIPEDYIRRHFLPFVERVSTEVEGQPQTALGNVLHTLASLARLTVVHNGAYNDLLARQIDSVPGLQERARNGFERGGNLAQFWAYGGVHVLEHLAELGEQGEKTGNHGLVRLLVDKGIQGMFDSVNVQLETYGIKDPRIPGYFRQMDGFVAKAKQTAYQIG